MAILTGKDRQLLYQQSDGQGTAQKPGALYERFKEAITAGDLSFPDRNPHIAMFDTSPTGDPILVSCFEGMKEARDHNDAVAMLRYSRRFDYRVQELAPEINMDFKIEWKPLEKKQFEDLDQLTKTMVRKIANAWCLKIDDLIMNGTGEEKADMPQIDYRDIGGHVENHSIPGRQPMYGRDMYGNPKVVATYEEAPEQDYTVSWASNGILTWAEARKDLGLPEIPEPVGMRFLYRVYVVDPEGDGRVVARVEDVIAASVEQGILKALVGLDLDRDLEDYDILVKTIGVKGTGRGYIRPKEDYE